jgi:type II secretory pathway pseudopilin PulG
MAENAPALRKRQQIESANKTMFIWVAIAAAIIGIAAVLAVSLFGQITFKQKVINEKNNTASTLHKNNEIVGELKKQIRILNTNQSLIDTPRLQDSEPISVILDALPSTANSSALGASLQQKLLAVDGVSIESLVVDPISGVEDSGNTGTSTLTDAGPNTITFKFAVTTDGGHASQLREVLRNIERSIRVINLTSVAIEQQGVGGKITMTAEGQAFYQPASSVNLKEKSIKP